MPAHLGKLQYEAAVATMVMIPDYTVADFELLGVPPEDFDLVYDNVQWRAEQRFRVTRTLCALLYGTTTVIGLGEGIVPAEYQAAVIATFVAPCNRRLAAMFLADAGKIGPAASDLSTGEMEPATGNQIFSLIVELSANEKGTLARQRFAERLGRAQENAVNVTGGA